MYRHKIEIEVADAVIDRYSIMEWETFLLAGGVIERDQLPLSYGAIAEIVAVELYKYKHFQGVEATQWKCKEATTYTDHQGFTVNTKVPRAARFDPREANQGSESLVIGISR